MVLNPEGYLAGFPILVFQSLYLRDLRTLLYCGLAVVMGGVRGRPNLFLLVLELAVLLPGNISDASFIIQAQELHQDIFQG